MGRSKVILDAGKYGYWKSRMRLNIRSIDDITYYKCKGLGHTHQECESDERQGKLMISVADEESKEDTYEDEEISNFVAFAGISEFVEERKASESDTDDSSSDEEDEIDIYKSFTEVRDALVETRKENLELKKENVRLEEKVGELQKALQAEKDLNMDNLNIMLEKMETVKRADDITKEYFLEKENSRSLQAELDQHRKQLKMLTGTKEFDKILTLGRVGKSNLGLGYSTGSGSTGKTVTFVSGGIAQDVVQAETRSSAQKPDPILRSGNRGKTTMGLGYEAKKVSNARASHRHKRHQGKQCYFCGVVGHIKAFCNKFCARVDHAWRQGRYYWNHGLNQVFIRKTDLYQNPARRTAPSGTRQRFCSNMALFEESNEVDNTGTWYFDSGCSRHMTGMKKNLQDVKQLKGGKVTFGCGTKGTIQGKGRTSEEQPQLMNVYLVQGLKSNLISVSQLCDEGLIVWFNKLECKAIDADGKAVLRGVRSGNDCYMWDQSAKCLSVRDDVELWHKRLGHLNIRHLTTLVNKEIVRGVPKLKGCEKIVCGLCNQGKQVKVQHKKVSDVQSKSALDLVHMDLMGPM
ncbi:unnamed protein product [Microthlaspi erraticum]|uniref:Uncharacterized protein n=1 Tax=Microthlaspi erraticum TaxID=1685480 RepID=A0A6D2KG02_9BRAS|nr:unnamed protein product [Microthlaspi erraticum]